MLPWWGCCWSHCAQLTQWIQGPWPGPLKSHQEEEEEPGPGYGSDSGRLSRWPVGYYIEQGGSSSHVRRNESMMAGEDATWLRLIIKAVLDNCHKFLLSIIQISPQRDAKCNRVWCDFKPYDAWCEVYTKCWWWMMCGYRDAWCEAIIKHEVKPSWCMLWSHHAAWCEAIMMHDVKSSCHIMWNPHACHDMKPPWCMMWSYHDIRYEAKMMHDMKLSCYMMWNPHD